MCKTGFLLLAFLFLAAVPFSHSAASNSVVIYAVYYDPFMTGEPNEAVALMNISSSAIAVGGFTVTDSVTGASEGTVTFPAYTIQPGQVIWIAKAAASFKTEFGFTADFEYGGTDTDPLVPDMTGTALLFSNTGDECILKNSTGTVIDSIVYEGGNVAAAGWSGTAVYPYAYFTEEGQILCRKLGQSDCYPIPDTDTFADWAQSTDEGILGKKISKAGWDTEHFFQTMRSTVTCRLEYWIAPDNVLENYLRYINNAAASIWIEGYEFESYQLEQAVARKLLEGVQVKILLEGGALGDQGKWVAREIEANGGEVYFMRADTATGIDPRYTYQHAKFCVIDGTWLLTGSENLNNSSFPADDRSNGTDGHRGVYIATNAPALVAHALDIYNRDVDPVSHKDVSRWNASTDSPPVDFIPFQGEDLITYPVQFWSPLILDGTFDFEAVLSPDNCLRENDSLLGMVARAGAGGKVYVEQLYEYKYWGEATSNPSADPNPRLEAYIAAARRGAEVKIILDSIYNDPYAVRGNTAAAAYVNGIASSEGLNLSCRVSSPTLTGIHNKMVLVHDGASGWTHTGSINGSENSNKANRELAIQIKSNEGFDHLATVFNYDWVNAGGSPIEVGPPGEPEDLKLSIDGGNLRFSWTAPAGCNDHSFSVYRGDLSSLASAAYSHDTALACSAGGGPFSLPLNDGRLGTADYFLVVANNAVEEGSYGQKTGNVQIPVSAQRCKSYQDTSSCN